MSEGNKRVQSLLDHIPPSKDTINLTTTVHLSVTVLQWDIISLRSGFPHGVCVCVCMYVFEPMIRACLKVCAYVSVNGVNVCKKITV